MAGVGGISGILNRVAQAADHHHAIHLEKRRELFVDDFLIDQMDDVRHLLHHPTPREIVLNFEKPWEGIYSGYETVLKDGDEYRFYYRGMPRAKHDFDTETTCVALSTDGLSWTKPELGLYEVNGTKKNNVVLARSRGCHNLAPFVDLNPEVKAEERYKAVGGTGKPGLLGFVSPDGYNWKQVQAKPIITKGHFDSQNVCFWSEHEKQYVCYFRVFVKGRRWIHRSTSKDFINWTKSVSLGLDGQPREHLYTNQLIPYYRANHIYVGFPTRFYPGRQVITEEDSKKINTPKEFNYIKDTTDIQFISTRGGAELSRHFMEGFIRPGRDLKNWTSRSNYAAHGMIQTGEDELSLYVKHQSGYPSIHVRRYTLRVDGFASIRAGYGSGEFVTKPITFTGKQLRMNYATSAGGGIRVELQAPTGTPIDGYSLSDCYEVIGDRTDGLVRWKKGNDLSGLKNTPIRLRVRMKDADLFALRFG